VLDRISGLQDYKIKAESDKHICIIA